MFFRSSLNQLLFAMGGELLSVCAVHYSPPIANPVPHVASHRNPSPSSLLPSAMSALRVATWTLHQRLERRLDVKARFADLLAYRSYLQHMWGFCAALEPRLAAGGVDAALPDHVERRKLPLLTRDLVALGLAPSAIERLSHCGSVPHCRDTSAALGCAYVLEGATLGGRTLLPLVQARLGMSAQHGACFLASYGELTASRWRSFGASVDAWCATPARTAGATATAQATFEALERWLCEEAA